MPTSPSNQVCNQLELWKLVLKKYLNRGISVSSNALGGDPYYKFILVCHDEFTDS